MATGAVLWFTGDLLCQSLVQSKEETENGVDWKRCARMTAYGAFISAPVSVFWYGALDRLSQRVFSSAVPTTVPSLLQRRLPWGKVLTAATLRTWKIISFKLAMDTILFDPLYLSLFFMSNGLLQNQSLSQLGIKLRDDLLETWLVDVAIWTPIQTMNFRYIKVLWQPLVVQSCNIVWNAYLSFVQHDKHPVAIS